MMRIYKHLHVTLALLILAPLVTSLSCNFDQGLCGWRQDRYDDFDWRIRSGPTPDATSGPASDHTSGRGQYVYIRSDDTRDQLYHAGLKSYFVDINTVTTITFWYHMNGNGIGTLSLLAYPPLGPPTTLWSLHGRQGNAWKQAGVTLPIGKFQLMFDATADHHFGGDLAIDDILVSKEPAVDIGLTRPPPKKTSTTSESTTTSTTPSPPTTTRAFVDLSCTFESGFCAWSQTNTDNFDWRRIKGLSQDRSSGPSGDHTTGNGYYSYIRGGDTKHPNEYARLTTPYIEVKSPSRFSFWYHMNGAGIGTLKVLRVSAYTGDVKELFSTQGRHGPDWRQVSVMLLPGAPFRLVIEATAKLHYGSDIAIDDLLGAILEEFLPTTITTTTPTPPTTEPKPLTCSFETDMCGWSQIHRGDKLDWSRGKGKSPDFVSGPSRDHTTGDGYYMFLNGRQSGNLNWKADLVSHDLDVAHTSSLTFWYLMNGVNIGTLDLLTLFPNGTMTSLWRKTGRQGGDWLESSVDLPKGHYRLMFSASARQHYGSDLAIDDITLQVDDGKNQLPVVG